MQAHLRQNQQFEEAQRWLHFLFDPTDDSDGPTPQRYWKVKPFQTTDLEQIEALLTNLSIDAVLLDEARALGINLSRSGEAGIRVSVKREKEQRWLAENKAQIDAWNVWVEQHDLPGEDIRAWR